MPAVKKFEFTEAEVDIVKEAMQFLVEEISGVLKNKNRYLYIDIQTELKHKLVDAESVLKKLSPAGE